MKYIAIAALAMALTSCTAKQPPTATAAEQSITMGDDDKMGVFPVEYGGVGPTLYRWYDNEEGMVCYVLVGADYKSGNAVSCNPFYYEKKK